MKKSKKVLLTALFMTGILMVIGCSGIGSEPSESEEASESSTSSDSGLLDEIKEVVQGKFELKQESITLEMGTELGDISEYVDADNYDDITMEIAPVDWVNKEGVDTYNHYFDEAEMSYYIPDVPPYIVFTRGEETLTMDINWIDTTPPTVESIQLDRYFVYQMEDVGELKLGCWTDLFTTPSGEELVKITDNSKLGIQKLVLDNFVFNGEVVTLRVPFENCVDGQTYTCSFTATDKCGNTSNNTFDVRIIFDISPETRQKLIDEGYSDAEIQVMVDEAIDRYMRSPS